MSVNPENGVMDKEEPLKTLKSYEDRIIFFIGRLRIFVHVYREFKDREKK